MAKGGPTRGWPKFGQDPVSRVLREIGEEAGKVSFEEGLTHQQRRIVAASANLPSAEFTVAEMSALTQLRYGTSVERDRVEERMLDTLERKIWKIKEKQGDLTKNKNKQA